MMPKESETAHTLLLISQLPSLEHGLALVRDIEAKKQEFEGKPKLINTESIPSDMRYNLGFIDALNWVLNRPGEARDILTKYEGE